LNPLWALRCRLACPPPPYRFDPRLDKTVRALCAERSGMLPILNLGSGTTALGPTVVNLDLQAFSGVHVIGDALRLPFREGSFRGVLLRGVLEHVRSAAAAIDEVRRVLMPGGFLYVEVPFLQPFHLSPEDHRRFTLPGLRTFLADFDETESGVQIGPWSAVAWLLREAAASLFSFGSLGLYRKVLALVGWSTFWLRELDRFVVQSPNAANSASAVYFLGKKRP
jgi:SAM-dependent methyltransferase